MPFKSQDLGAKAPEQSHFGILTGEDGSVLAVPPGATMYIIEDPTNPEKIFPLTLVKVSRNQIVFRLICHDPSLNRTYTYKLAPMAGRPVSKRQLKQARDRSASTK